MGGVSVGVGAKPSAGCLVRLANPLSAASGAWCVAAAHGSARAGLQKRGTAPVFRPVFSAHIFATAGRASHHRAAVGTRRHNPSTTKENRTAHAARESRPRLLPPWKAAFSPSDEHCCGGDIASTPPRCWGGGEGVGGGGRRAATLQRALPTAARVLAGGWVRPPPREPLARREHKRRLPVRPQRKKTGPATCGVGAGALQPAQVVSYRGGEMPQTAIW